MQNKSNYLFILLAIVIISFPSVCFSKSKTVEGVYCDIYLGDLKNKNELKEFRQNGMYMSILRGLHRLTGHPGKRVFNPECFGYIIDNYLGKIVVISHTEEGRKICDTVNITLDPEVIDAYLSQDI